MKVRQVYNSNDKNEMDEKKKVKPNREQCSVFNVHDINKNLFE